MYKPYIIILALWFSSLIALRSQTIGVRSIAPVTKDNTIRPCYDTSFVYIDLSKLEENPHYYDNQEILFSPNVDTIRYYDYYGGFYVKDSIEIKNYPDTVWLKRRKGKIKDGDYCIKYPKTNVYVPTLVKNEYVCCFDSFQKVDDNGGFYTPFEHIEGHSFIIVSTEKKSNGVYIFHLLDDKGISVDFVCRLFSKDYPSVLMMSYINRYREDYIEKCFHLKEEGDSKVYLFKELTAGKIFPVSGELRCLDISLVKGNLATVENIGGNYVNLYKTNVGLFFRDNNGKDFCLFSENEGLNYFRIQPNEELHENFRLEIGKSYYRVQLKDLIPSTDYYTQKKQERIQKEEHLAKENARKIERKANLIKKYGQSNAELILKGHVKIGMTAEMCREAWGKPNDINRSVGSWGVHEQWCYKWGGYLYIENGILTSFQN